jgi:hypothetical protein
MNREELLRQLDAEISRLTQARDLVAGSLTPRAGRRTRKLASSNRRDGQRPRRISAEGRARIAAAQRRRWARQRRTKGKA